MERLLIGTLVLGLMLGIMVVIAWLAIRESRREYDQELRWMAEKFADRGRADPPIRTPVAAQTPETTPS